MWYKTVNMHTECTSVEQAVHEGSKTVHRKQFGYAGQKIFK